jgi:hypothetical protein
MIYSIKGVVVNGQSLNPIKGAKVSISPIMFIFTDTNGNFTIEEDIPESGSLSMIVNAPGFKFVEPALYKGDNTLKTDLGVIQLQPLVSSLNQEKLASSQLSTNQIEELSKGNKGADYFAQERLTNQISTIKSTLIPSILTMVAGFGLTQISNIKPEQFLKYVEQASCPTQAELITLINKKNKLVKQLNNTLKLIDNTTKALGITGGIIEGLNIAFNILKNLPIPVSTGVPGVPGLPTNVILAIQDNKDKIDKLIGKLRTINTGILSILVLLRQVLLQALQLLNLLDSLVQKCYPDADQEKVALELTALTNQQSQQLSPVIINVNGFEMGVETEVTNNSLKRRRAIARNKSGVVMLKGEFSFSSIDQILIDELVFYIQQNDLKAD